MRDPDKKHRHCRFCKQPMVYRTAVDPHNRTANDVPIRHWFWSCPTFEETGVGNTMCDNVYLGHVGDGEE